MRLVEDVVGRGMGFLKCGVVVVVMGCCCCGSFLDDLCVYGRIMYIYHREEATKKQWW